MFKVYEDKGEKASEILNYSYTWLRKVDTFDDFEIWNTDSDKVPSDRIITEDELEKLREKKEEESEVIA